MATCAKRKRKAKKKPESYAQGLIWVEDTSQEGALERLQQQFDDIGDIMADFEVKGFRDFAQTPCNRLGFPALFQLFANNWGENNPHEQHSSGMAELAFDQTVLRERVPVNWHCTADLFMRYTKDADNGIEPDLESSYQYFSVLRLEDVERAGMLTDDDNNREESVIALVESRAGIVIPLPDHAVVSWFYFGDGEGMEIAVYEGKSLRWQMEHYPEYFDTKEFVNEDDVELDILNCTELLDRIQNDGINPRTLSDAEVPSCPAHERKLNERKRQ